MNMKKNLVLSVAVAGLAFGSASSAMANIVTDGVFADSANFSTNWNPNGSFIFPTGYNGQSAVGFGTVGTLGNISQSLSTTPGQSYQISFDLAHPCCNNPTSEFQAVFGGNTLVDLLPLAVSSNYVSYSFNSVANSLHTLLQFNEREDPAFMYLTNVSVTGISAVPLPASV